jgi:hypothetical protein
MCGWSFVMCCFDLPGQPHANRQAKTKGQKWLWKAE